MPANGAVIFHGLAKNHGRLVLALKLKLRRWVIIRFVLLKFSVHAVNKLRGLLPTAKHVPITKRVAITKYVPIIEYGAVYWQRMFYDRRA
jgi:hypothetical protein